MSKIFYERNEERYPHAPDVLERLTAEKGFAGGWAMHQKPVPKYYFDAHLHYDGKLDQSMAEGLRSAMTVWDKHDVHRVMVLFNVYGHKRGIAIPEYALDEWFPWLTVEDLQEFAGDLLVDDRFFWAAWIDHREPTPELIHHVADAGVNCIKLHNAPVIETNAPYDLWLGEDWEKVFKVISERKLPVIIHVTQRLSSSIYTGGGRNTYWTKGWENGVTYGNEDLLQAFLTCCKRHPKIPFIGAHQLHLGWDRLDELFTEYHNLYVDTTVGCMLRLYDDFYPLDQEYLRQVFIKWSDRIIFGTDTYWGGQEPNESVLLQHMRFITSLDLPADVLDRVCYDNIERILNI